MGLSLATNQRVAIKIMNEKLTDGPEKKTHEIKVVESFLNEIKMCAKSRHRNIIQVLDFNVAGVYRTCLLYTSPSPRDKRQSRMPSSA